MNTVAGLPGWFGKLPGMGDFAHRRLPISFREGWDHWLQGGLSRMREQHAGWTARYLEAPVWCFVLAPQVLDERCWLGVLMPSVDGVGRYFPFALAVELEDAPIELRGDALALVLRWWALAARAALEALDNDMDALGFDALLQRLFVDAAPQDAATDADGAADAADPADATTLGTLRLPDAGASLWLTDPAAPDGLRIASLGLPRGAQFDALFGIGEEQPAAAPEDNA